MVAQHLTKSFSHLWPIRNFCAWVFALMIQAPPDVTRMYGRWSECAFKSHGSRFVNTLSAGCSFDDEYSVCSVHKTHTSQIPVAEVIFDTRKYPVSQWANHRAVSADRILLPVWAEIKQQQLQPLFSWTENNRESEWKTWLLYCSSIVGMKGDKLDCAVDGSISTGTMPQHTGDKLNSHPIMSTGSQTACCYLISFLLCRDAACLPQNDYFQDSQHVKTEPRHKTLKLVRRLSF